MLHPEKVGHNTKPDFYKHHSVYYQSGHISLGFLVEDTNIIRSAHDDGDTCWFAAHKAFHIYMLIRLLGKKGFFNRNFTKQKQKREKNERERKKKEKEKKRKRKEGGGERTPPSPPPLKNLMVSALLPAGSNYMQQINSLFPLIILPLSVLSNLPWKSFSFCRNVSSVPLPGDMHMHACVHVCRCKCVWPSLFIRTFVTEMFIDHV